MSLGEQVTLEELERDPYPVYARLREEEPVSWAPAVGLWLVTRYEDVRYVDLTPEVVTAATEPSTLNRTSPFAELRRRQSTTGSWSDFRRVLAGGTGSLHMSITRV